MLVFYVGCNLLVRLTGRVRACSFNWAGPMLPNGLRHQPKHGRVYRAVPARARRLSGCAILGLSQKGVPRAGLLGHVLCGQGIPIPIYFYQNIFHCLRSVQWYSMAEMYPEGRCTRHA